MEYTELAPPASLRPFVQCLWRLRGASQDATPQRVVPDGSVELVLHLGDEFRRHEADGRVVAQPRALVVGVVDRWLMLESTGAVDVIGARFHPGAVRGVLGIPQTELLGACHDLQDLGVAALEEVHDQVGHAATDTDRVGVFSAALVRGSQQAAAPPGPVMYATRRIIGSAGQAPIGGLALETGMSQRHLERHFQREVGLTAKGLARIRRFHAVIGRLSSETPPQWAALAAACGYADQAHLVREFREFAGTTPAAYWRELHPIGDLFHRSVDFLQDPAAVPA